MVTPYPCHCLVVLRDEANKEHPGRDTRSDGWIGDQTHSNTGAPENGGSKHNPNRHGAVDARDFDNSNLDVARFVACAIKHPSTRNVIYNRKIRSKGYSGGLSTAYAYHGPSPHTEHVHVDVEMTTAKENDGRAWGYYRGGKTTPVVAVPVVHTTESGSPAKGSTAKGGMTRMPVLRRTGGTSSATRALQRALTRLGFTPGQVDGGFGPNTDKAVRAFQKAHRLGADGVVGPKTWVALAQALLVKAGQHVAVDGSFGPGTAAAAVAFQKSRKLTADGIIGPVTLTKLLG
jgi:putative peptidoglycan binding protein